MSDESAPTPETPSNPSAEGAPRVRRISNPRPKKQAKSAPAADNAPAPAKASAKFPEFLDAPEAPSPRGDWPEPDAASSGTSSFPENPKRKRRRKKGKGNGPQNQSPANEGETFPLQAPEPVESAPSHPVPHGQPQGQPPRQHQAPRPKHDAELLARFAWKIYLSEVSEEGVALVGDNDAKELSRRCFRLAEIFLEEQARRH